MFPEDVKKGDALIVFSRRRVHEVAGELQDYGIRCSLIYGALPYDVRHEQAALFSSGRNKVLVATDAIGMGMNLPIRRVVFLEDDKFDGKSRRFLHSSEFKQIAGRAGRRGLYEKGYAASAARPGRLRRALIEEDETIDRAVIGFPRTLIGIDAPLSAIIRQWMDAEGNEGYEKEVAERELQLAREMEAEGIDDKEFIYRFITIPFDEKNEGMRGVFAEMYRAEWRGSHLSIPKHFWGELPGGLRDLEVLYQLSDLLYIYGMRFGVEEPIEDILSLKKELSEKMIEILSAKQRAGK
ncbi:MAG: hypothetical protein K6E30_06105 [Lachnospiraceae bacterium]|nr:hypothetical protein [Lachnospiraceae bacterium]